MHFTGVLKCEMTGPHNSLQYPVAWQKRRSGRLFDLSCTTLAVSGEPSIDVPIRALSAASHLLIRKDLPLAHSLETCPQAMASNADLDLAAATGASPFTQQTPSAVRKDVQRAGHAIAPSNRYFIEQQMNYEVGINNKYIVQQHAAAMARKSPRVGAVALAWRRIPARAAQSPRPIDRA
eukprot:6204036-Pleurochrysis_carterae.AAC.2